MSGKVPAGGLENDSLINILLVDDIAESRQVVQKLLSIERDFKVIGQAASGKEAITRVKEAKPDIVIMDINMPDMDGLEASKIINKFDDSIGIIIMSVQDDPTYISQAMMYGARAFISKPPEPEKLITTIRNVYNLMEPARIRKTMEPSMMPGAKEKSERGHVIAVYGAQGGVGTTMVAINLASALMGEGVRVVLVDADIGFGDVQFSLNLPSKSNTILDLFDYAEEEDEETINQLILNHDSGLKVVVAPPPIEKLQIEVTGLRLVSEVIKNLAKHFDYVVVDTGTPFDDVNIPVLDVADIITIVTTPYLLSLKNTKQALEILQNTLEMAPEKFLLVLNKTTDPKKNKRLQKGYIEGYFHMRVRSSIPLVDELMLEQAISKGLPLLALQRGDDKAPAKQIKELADYIVTYIKGDEEGEVGKGKSSKEDDQPSGILSGFFPKR